MKKFSTEFRLVTGLGLGLLLLLTAGWQLYRALQEYRNNSNWVEHTYLVMGALDDMKSVVLEMESVQRLYLITGDASFIGQREAQTAQVQAAMKKIAELTADNPRQQLQSKVLTQKLNERLNTLEQTMRVYNEGGFEAVRKRLISGTPRIVMESLMEQIRQMEQEEQVLLSQRTRQVEQSSVQARNVGMLIVVITLLGWFLLWQQIRVDVKHRSAAEKAVHESESLLRQILNILPVGVFISDRNGLLTQINQCGEKIWGGTRHVSMDQYAEYVGWWPDSGKRIAASEWALARTMQTGETILNELADIRCFDGTRKTITNNTAPLRDDSGHIVGGLSVNVDVTDFIYTERKLRAAAHYDDTQVQAQNLFATSFDREEIFSGLLTLLAERHGFAVSALYGYDEWNALFRCEAAHGLGREVPRQFALGEGLLGQAALSGKTNFLDIGYLNLQTGLADFTPTQVLMLPVIYQERRLAVLVLAATTKLIDSDQAFLEKLVIQLGVALHNLRQYSDLKMLADRLRVSSEEIAAKNQQLEQASLMKSEFLANMSHELRTPLNAIIGFSEILRDGLMGEMNARQNEGINDIFNSGKHLLSLINDILDLSKIEAGKMNINFEAVSIAPLVQASLQIVREQALMQGLHLSAEVQDDIGEAWLDEVKIKQIIYNLLSNAVKFTPEGGRVNIAARRVDGLKIAGGRYDHYLEIKVSDTGIGMSTEEQARLFQPFTQIDSSLARRHQGTGLGLALVKRMAELHGGSVTLDSEPNRGSTFTVLLPLRSVAQVEAISGSTPIPVSASSAPAPSIETEGKLLALVIEDDDQAAEVLRLQLESEGFRIVRATSAESALALAEKECPDLITLDILLPGMDGWEFLQRFKLETQFASVPVVIISIVADRGRGMSLGAAQVMQKPVSREVMNAALSQLGFASRSGGRRLSALIIDDDPKAIQLITTYLDSFGYRTLSALGGQEGIHTARHTQPDLIVLDLMMPEVNGFDVVEALKADTSTAGIPVMILTAKQVTTDDRMRLNGDVKKVMEKSEFNHGRFIGEVRRAMAGRGK
ncbi:response regulator [Undibacterium sp. CY18W]|uniref:histidine kinase n=1 Tax=Undibacterium hunanense TaxID=2762292 RepID=A0ABR6ZL25_9BURK|nr:response regulator [Undibacterium hunanense]MBC3916602.1 response regulator [Undibacterium hunanense]